MAKIHLLLDKQQYVWYLFEWGCFELHYKITLHLVKFLFLPTAGIISDCFLDRCVGVKVCSEQGYGRHNVKFQGSC